MDDELLHAARDFRREGVPYHAIPRRLLESFNGVMSPNLEESFYRLGHAAAWRDEIAALRHIWGSETGEEALAAALYALMHFTDTESVAACLRQYGKWADRAVMMSNFLMT
ncbi:MAG: hypothetical protein U0670_19270 [Anaerolineae bacterium]